MIRGLSFVLLTFCAALAVSAQAPNTPSHVDANDRTGARDTSQSIDNPVAQVRNARSWEMGPFANWGTGVGDRSDFKFFSVGFQFGKPITPVLHAGWFSGQFELAANLMPLWQAYTPAPHEQTFVYRGVTYTQPVGGGTYTGVSLTPVIFRWNFLTRSRRIQPWFQGAGGLIYTSHKFPPDVLVPHGTPGATSVFNFSPQGGIGLHYFTRPKRSIDLGLNAVHISSASLGDRNPGVNASLQIQFGYTWWK
ncbi:MAG TPA: acyloxyacyl hydrolase [Terracidiphilus sp.]